MSPKKATAIFSKRNASMVAATLLLAGVLGLPLWYETESSALFPTSAPKGKPSHRIQHGGKVEFSPLTNPDGVVDYGLANFVLASSLRLDECMSGLPHNTSVVTGQQQGGVLSDGEASDRNLFWVQTAQELSPECFAFTGYRSDISTMTSTSMLTSTSYHLNFQTAAKVGSMTLTNFAKCRYNAVYGGYVHEAASNPPHRGANA